MNIGVAHAMNNPLIFIDEKNGMKKKGTGGS